MSTTSASIRVDSRKNIFSNEVFATTIFVVAEIMFFIALISSYLVIKGDASRFSVPQGIKLPVIETGFNTILLLLSGLALFRVKSFFKGQYLSFEGKVYYAWSILLGLFFVVSQGYEWIQLMSFGLSMKSSIYGGLFFLIIGTHGFHAICGILAMTVCFAYSRGDISKNALTALEIFWYLIVLIWPVLYFLVYF